ncbi:MAG TPA: aspartate kinase [Levilinea sp.]|nr:aspartate kinase [Levilinea sp.]
MGHQKTLVMKFGGTSLGTIEAMGQAARITTTVSADWPRLVVVASALSGVTDLLIDSANWAARGDQAAYQRAIAELEQRHHAHIDNLVRDATLRMQVQGEVDELLGSFINLCQAIEVLGEASPRALDAVSALGERLSSRILSAAVQSSGARAAAVDATHLIVTDDHHQAALPDMRVSIKRIRDVIEPLWRQGIIPIVTGYIAATPAGVTTTLGRGGSDYSASILALALQANQLWLWTDVDGVMTADPRIVPEARTISELSYREVAEMAYFGAKVLHPKSIHPVIEGGIALRVCNTFNPANPGTWLVADRNGNGYGRIRAVTAIRGLQLITLSGTGMLGVPGVAGRIFSAVATTGVSVPLIIESSSEQAICFPAPVETVCAVIHSLECHLAMELQRGDIDHIQASGEVDIITVICPGLRSVPGVAGQIFSTLGGKSINILGISFGASDVSINLVVNAADTPQALQAVHTLIPQPTIEKESAQ